MLTDEERKAHRKESRRKQYYKNRVENIRKAAEWKKENRDRANASERARNLIRRREDPEFRECCRLYSRIDYWKHREERLAKAKYAPRVFAMNRVRDALRKKEISQPSNCPNCGSTKNIQAHHHDYSKPLEIVWLCSLCHRGLHAMSRHGAVDHASPQPTPVSDEPDPSLCHPANAPHSCPNPLIQGLCPNPNPNP